jgi:uncharacterized protein
MSPDVLESYIRQRLEIDPGPLTHFEWHGGEPTLAGIDFYRNVVELQERYRPAGRTITNGLQTNGLLLNDEWVGFLHKANFRVGLSLDGPREFHDSYRTHADAQGSHQAVERAFERLSRARVPCDVLCVVHAGNVRSPKAVLGYFRDLGVKSLQFLPLVERVGVQEVSERTASAEAIGDFLCQIFDEWLFRDLGDMTVQLFEEALRPLLGLPHALCLFRETCGEVIVLEHNGDLYACDHFVDDEHRLGNLRDAPLRQLLAHPALHGLRQAKSRLPRPCLECDVLEFCHGGCPKDRFVPLTVGQGNKQESTSYLCPAYQRFFRHSRPGLRPLADYLKASLDAPRFGSRRSPAPSVGANQPCPCGSGEKFKRCCRP